MITVRKTMTNEISKIQAAIVCEERAKAIAEARLFGLRNRLSRLS